MSKSLKALEELSDLASCGDLQFQERHNVFRRSAGVEKYKPIIEKELKALEIIKEKNVDIRGIKLGVTVGVYNALWAKKEEWYLTQEEFDLLKEVLC